MIEAKLLQSNSQPRRARRVKDESLDDFVLKYRWVANEQLSKGELGIIESTKEELLRIYRKGIPGRHIIFEDGPLTLWYAREERSWPPTILAVVGDELAGGMHGGTNYVFPEFRGMGLGTRIVISAFEYSATNPSHFSESGRKARIAAHREAVLEAYDRNEFIPEFNKVHYKLYLQHVRGANENL